MNSALINTHVLMVLAHCDDELVCGWPILQNPDIRKSIIIVSSDINNKGRKWCSHRRYVTLDLCRNLSIDVSILDHNSDFYKSNHRNGSLIKIENSILDSISKYAYDYIFTHNPNGEYGHLDHKFINNLLFRSVDEPIIISDISMKSDWSNELPVTKRHNHLYYNRPIEECYLDLKFYQNVMQFYKTRGVWTWSQQPNTRCKLFLL